MTIKRRVLSLIFISITLLVSAPKSASAQNTGVGFAVIPPSFELAADKGQSVTKTVKLENLTDVPLPLIVTRKNFTAQGEEGDVNLTTEENSFSLASWIDVQPEKIILAPHQREEFTFTIIVPENAEPGGHFGSLVFATVPDSSLGQSGALLSQEIGVLILTKVAGETREQASIESFSPDLSFFEFGPVPFTTRIKNEGNVHIKPTGNITITDMMGNKETVSIESRNILPDAIRKTNTTYRQKLLIGKYTAELNLSYGSNGQTLHAQAEFYAFPIRYGVIGLLILLGLIFLRRRLFKAFKEAFKALLGK